MIKTRYEDFQSSTKIVPQGNLTADREIKRCILQCKDK